MEGERTRGEMRAVEEVGDPDGPGDSLAGGEEGMTRGKSKRPRGGKGNADA